MQCYAELTPPTAVTHSLSLPFTSAQSNNLVVAKSSLLQIFTTKTIAAEVDDSKGQRKRSVKSSERYDRRLNDDEGIETSFLGGDAQLLRTDRSVITKLVLVGEFPLAGTIIGVARIKTPDTKSGGEALLLAFKDAKLSLVEWDPEVNGLSTVSIHYYEQDELQGAPWSAPLGDYENFLVSDPGSRCAALRFGARNLAVLPFSQPDEDIDLGDWDAELDGPKPAAAAVAAAGDANGASSSIEQTPYAPSFVLRLSQLDPALAHPVHLAFLYEYREPTFGILSSTLNTSGSLGRRDHLTFMVFTLDLQQKASTTILSVSGLPQDLFRVIALPPPVGGALLLGANELIHIDQSGKPTGVAVNGMAKQATSFSLVDKSDLDLRLEGCNIELMSPAAGDLLLVLSDGRLGLISFHIDGRTVSGLNTRIIPREAGGATVTSAASSLSLLGRNTMFVGSEEGDSVVLGWTAKDTATGRRKSRVPDATAELDADGDMGEDEEDEDDLYGGDDKVGGQPLPATNGTAKAGDLTFRVHDRLFSLAPIQAMTFGKPPSNTATGSDKKSADIQSELQLVCAVGRGGSGSLALLNRQIQSQVVGKFDFPEAKGFWTLSVQKPAPKALQTDKSKVMVAGDADPSLAFDRFMIVAKVDTDGFETSDVYALTAAGFESLTGTEFEPAAGFTVEAGTMGQQKRIIQVLKSEVRCYDGDFGLSQILPMLDEETGAEPRIVSASIADPYLLLVRDDSSIFLAKIDKSNELEEVEKEDETLVSAKWLTGCLYADTTGVFSSTAADERRKEADILLFCLNAAGALYIYALSDMTKPVYVADGLSYIPPILTADYSARKGTAREVLTEILVADLGDQTSKSPYLILRHPNDDLTLYEPFRASIPSGKDERDFTLMQTLRFQKISNPVFAKEPEAVVDDDAAKQPRNMPLRPCRDIAGYTTVFLPGASPSFVIKSSKSLPRVLGLQGAGVQAMSSFHTEGCVRGFIYADSNGIARVTQLPANTNYAEIGVAARKVPIGQDITGVAYHPPTGTYAVGCTFHEPFELPKDDDYHKEWARETLLFKPQVERGLVKLLSQTNWSVIDTIELDPNEIPMAVETIDLEVSEITHERRQLIVVGTALPRGEDLPIRGRIYVYDVVEVIPQPNRPETHLKLKLVAKEEIPRGAVTAISPVGTQGLMLVAQGQKCMVRGLKEDGTLLPVAFMDMNCYVTAVRELPGTGMCLMADAFKGVWFTGYTEEPYKMILFGKSSTKLETINVDFLPDGTELYIVAADSDGNLHVLQFDPEHPKSLQGHLLLHRTTFNLGAHQTTHSLLLPNTSSTAQLEPYANGTATNGTHPKPHPPHLLLLSSPTGVLATLTPLSEPSYRNLSSLSTQLANTLPQVAGLNPRAHRAAYPSSRNGNGAPGVDAGVGRTIVDGALLARWMELGCGRRGEIAARVVGGGGSGGSAEASLGSELVRRELEGVLGWGGMAYF